MFAITSFHHAKLLFLLWRWRAFSYDGRVRVHKARQLLSAVGVAAISTWQTLGEEAAYARFDLA